MEPGQGSTPRCYACQVAALRQNRSPRVHLVVLYTEGPPHDAGIDLAREADPLITLARKHFDSVRVHTPRTLIEQDPSWADYFADVTQDIVNHPKYSDQLKWNETWARVGLQQWKPHLIRQELQSESVSAGDIVFYHDANTVKYPDYLKKVSRQAAWLRKQMTHLDVLGFDDNGVPLTSDVKPELIDTYVGSDRAGALRHLWSGALAIRKTPAGLHFATRWSELSTFDNLSPLTALPTPPGFIWNAVDQAVLAALWHSRDLLEQEVRREIVYLHRSRAIPPPSPKTLALKRMIRRVRRLAKKSAR